MHSKSTRQDDPLVEALYGHLERDGFKTDKCDTCHMPLKKVLPGSPVADEGVNCLVCHSIEKIHNKKATGSDYFKFDITQYGNGPTDPKKMMPPVDHPVKQQSLFENNKICIGCHQDGEADFIIAKKRKTLCRQCHMPAKLNERSADSVQKLRAKVHRHAFDGGHSPMLLSLSLVVTGHAARQDENTVLNLTIDNDAYHPIPTGFPYRALYIKVEALGKNSAVLWSNYTADPYKESPQSYFGRRYKKNEAPYAHHGKEVKPVWDQAFPALETTQLSYKTNAEGVSLFRVAIYYRLVSEDVAETLGVDPSDNPEEIIYEEFIPVDQYQSSAGFRSPYM